MNFELSEEQKMIREKMQKGRDIQALSKPRRVNISNFIYKWDYGS